MPFRALPERTKARFSLLLAVGDNCRTLFNNRVRGVHPRFVQADELWTFVNTKERHLRPDSPMEWGDSYIWMAIDSETKMVLSYLVAKRKGTSAYDFIRDLSERVAGRFQLTIDGLRSYVPAVEECSGADIDFVQLVKLYGSQGGDGPDCYEPSKVTATIPVVISGDPDEARISTSHVERANLSVRTHLRRFTRLSLGFSKTVEYLTAAVNLYMAFFNFVRVHQTLRVTPAMRAGLTDHIWTVQELLEAR